MFCFLSIHNCNSNGSLFEEGGDWERKNRLKVYEGLYCMSTRNFKKAADLFLDSISTFTTYEIFPYDTFIFYTVLASIISLDRVSLKQKVTTTLLLNISFHYLFKLHIRSITYCAGCGCTRDFDSNWKNSVLVRVHELPV